MPVYFAQAGENGPVKIGWAVDVRARIAELQCGCPEILTVLRLIDGDRRSESWVHREFAHLRTRGEWFRFDPAMLSVTPNPAPAKRGRLPASDTLLADIQDFLAETGMTPTAFGRETLNDPGFVFALRLCRDYQGSTGRMLRTQMGQYRATGQFLARRKRRHRSDLAKAA